MDSWLVTGGAGYIGAHVAWALRDAGHDVVVLDDLSAGDPGRLPPGVELCVGSVLDTDPVADLMRSHEIRGIVHLAGVKAVEDSVRQPLAYYELNVAGMLSLLTAMVRSGVPRLVFSSSAAVYGAPATPLVTEESPTSPVSPYGRTKLICEWMLRDAARAHGLSWAALRYFNVAGAARPQLADRGTGNLIPRIFDAIENGRKPEVYGSDYPTADGTCVRDYVHVADVADAHAAVVGQGAEGVFNVGCGRGASVLEVLTAARRATGINFSWALRPPRAGDAPHVVADTRRISTRLLWQPRNDLDAIVRDAWRARYPAGIDGNTGPAQRLGAPG